LRLAHADLEAPAHLRGDNDRRKAASGKRQAGSKLHGNGEFSSQRIKIARVLFREIGRDCFQADPIGVSSRCEDNASGDGNAE
jgi:hypothetical protein